MAGRAGGMNYLKEIAFDYAFLLRGVGGSGVNEKFLDRRSIPRFNDFHADPWSFFKPQPTDNIFKASPLAID